MSKRMSKTKEDFIINLYVNKEYTQQRIAKILKTYNTTIRRALIRRNIRVRSNTEIMGYALKNPFKGNSKSDYFLGLLIADGCISNGKITLGLQEADLEVLRKYAFFINCRLNSYYHSVHGVYQYYVMCRNVEIIEHLKRQANFENKSQDAEIYTNLN